MKDYTLRQSLIESPSCLNTIIFNISRAPFYIYTLQITLCQPFYSQDLNINSPHCLLYISYNFSSKNLLLNQYLFFFLFIILSFRISINIAMRNSDLFTLTSERIHKTRTTQLENTTKNARVRQSLNHSSLKLDFSNTPTFSFSRLILLTFCPLMK